MFKFNFLEKIFERFGYTKQTGNINSIYNYYAPVNIGIGNVNKLLNDPPTLLQAETTINKTDLISGSLELLVKVDQTFLLGSSEVEGIIIFFQKVFDKNKNARVSQSLMKGAFFALLSENKGNTEWEEHCASSLREFFHEWRGSAGTISTAFNKLKKNGSKYFPNITNNKEMYDRQRLYYEYFSAKCHHNHDNAVRSLREIYSDRELKNDTSELFKKTVAKFLKEMNKFIKLTSHEPN